MDCRDYRKNHEAYSAYPLSEDVWDCPEAVFRCEESSDQFAIGPRAGGGDPVAISFCPICGVKLPNSRKS